MLIYKDLSEVSYNINTVVTLGTFDGIHIGHKKIIGEVVRKASNLGGRSFVVTFSPHPRNVISGSDHVKLLSTPAEKAKLLEEFGVQNLLIVKFTKEFSQLGPDKFIENYIINGIGAKEIIIGYDHHFGKGRGGDIDFLKSKGRDSGFDVTVIPACTIDGITVSSSKIRNAVSEGDISRANSFIGRKYSFAGVVVRGDKRGRELGFPTANLKIENEVKLLPAIGIYAVEVTVKEKKYLALLSIGKRPTFYTSGEIVPEVYIYDFDDDIYDEFITVDMIERIRGEEKFTSADELVKQMNEDKINGMKIFQKLNN